MGANLEFDFLHYDRVCEHIKVVNGMVTSTVFAKDKIDRFIGNRPKTIETILDALEDRCFSRNRPDRDELCRILGLRQYNPLDIVRVTHGKVWGDHYWIRFEDEKDLTYKEVLRKDAW